MKDLIISVVLCVCGGTVVLVLCPKTSIGKPIAFLCSAVVTYAVLSVVCSGFNNAGLPFTLPEISQYDFAETANSSVCSAVEKTVAENLFSAVFGLLGVYPESVKVEIGFTDGQFYLVSADIFVKTENEEELKDNIYQKTGLDVSVRAP